MRSAGGELPERNPGAGRRAAIARAGVPVVTVLAGLRDTIAADRFDAIELRLVCRLPVRGLGLVTGGIASGSIAGSRAYRPAERFDADPSGVALRVVEATGPSGRRRRCNRRSGTGAGGKRDAESSAHRSEWSALTNVSPTQRSRPSARIAQVVGPTSIGPTSIERYGPRGSFHVTGSPQQIGSPDGLRPHACDSPTESRLTPLGAGSLTTLPWPQQVTVPSWRPHSWPWALRPPRRTTRRGRPRTPDRAVAQQTTFPVRVRPHVWSWLADSARK
jgi:hypothetical protein